MGEGNGKENYMWFVMETKIMKMATMKRTSVFKSICWLGNEETHLILTTSSCHNIFNHLRRFLVKISDDTVFLYVPLRNCVNKFWSRRKCIFSSCFFVMSVEEQ